jgi:hypothetical protein
MRVPAKSASVWGASIIACVLANFGLIKVQRFRTADHKMAYLYKLTPASVADKYRVTQHVLSGKLDEHECITAEIEQLRREGGVR